ncbi:MAG TPA: biotin/lipoyl-binding protein, partial [Myxococcota bacterium]|nr:biotin/lipoyl-binding protein [Myxococcota bacterium]
ITAASEHRVVLHGDALEVDGLRFKVRVVQDGDTVHVHLHGHDVSLTRAPRFGERRDAAQSGARKAPMPGKVVAVKVAAGDRVAQGQVLVILEAMKMEHAIESGSDGVVTEVLVQVGDVVAADQELVTVGPAPTGS